MAQDRERPAFGGLGGGTGGTGDRNASATPENAGARQPESNSKDSLAAGDDSVDAAIGAGAKDKVSGTGTAAARSGRASSEGGDGRASPADPGDPGGMGGVGTNATPARGRPPGGVSPIDGDQDEG